MRKMLALVVAMLAAFTIAAPPASAQAAFAGRLFGATVYSPSDAYAWRDSGTLYVHFQSSCGADSRGLRATSTVVRVYRLDSANVRHGLFKKYIACTAGAWRDVVFGPVGSYRVIATYGNYPGQGVTSFWAEWTAAG